MAKRSKSKCGADHWQAQRHRATRPEPPLGPGDAVILASSQPSGWADSLPRRPWLVVECACGLCERGDHVALDVPRSPEMIELYPEAGLWTHVSVFVLRRCGELSRLQAEAWGDLMSTTGLGNKLGVAFENDDPSSRAVLNEVAALALADVLGGIDITAEQARQLDWWREQRGGELTPGQLEQVRAWQRERRSP